MGAKESRRNTGSPCKQSGKVQTGIPRGTGLGCGGGGEARSSEDARNERRAKGPQFQGDATSGARAEIGADLPPPEKLLKLQKALHGKAKGNPDYRFYSLYDKLYRPDVLAEAWRRCRANAGAAGVDDESFTCIEAQGVGGWLGELAQSLKDKSYQPDAVGRVWIPKPNGKQRPLGIPTIRDRVVQMAAVLLLEPIFEADLPIFLTSNKAFGDWASVFASDPVMASAALDRLLHRSTIINIRGDSYRLNEKRLAGITTTINNLTQSTYKQP